MLLSPFRLEHYRSMLLGLLARKDVEFITYDDLRWQEGDDHRTGYPLEWASWRKSINSGELNPNTVYVLLQHDIDSGPRQTIDMLHLESEYGVLSTTMVFNKWRGANLDGELMDYPADWDAMVRFERHGFAFGYHCNAFHNNRFVEKGIYELFNEDLVELRRKLSISCFSPHGGQTLNGQGNASFDYLTHTGINIKHVHNGCSPRFNSTYTDGGLIKRLRDGVASLDIFSWISALKPGGRYRILIHPQYFSDENYQPLSDVTAPWYLKLTTGLKVGQRELNF